MSEQLDGNAVITVEVERRAHLRVRSRQHD